MATAGVQIQDGVAAAVRPSFRVRIARRMPLVLWLLIVVLSLVELWMIAVTLDRPAPDQWGFRGFEAVLALSFGSVGALIAARRPENRIGWLTLLVSVVAAAQAIVNQYPVLAEAVEPALAGADVARWIAAWIWAIPSVSLMTLLPLLFPTGRLLSRRWRFALVLVALAMAVQVIAIVLATRPLGPVPPTSNPARYFEQIGPIIGVGYGIQLLATVVAAASAVVRYRRAGVVERQQIKWIAFAAIFLPFTGAAGFSGVLLGELALIASAMFAAAALAIAILRYRLYEIDLILNRTLVYGALTAVLAGVYTASITLSQRVFSAITGDRSDAAIVITTLIVAATFTPLKSRLQAYVDKRVKPTETSTNAEQRQGLPSPDWAADAARALSLMTRLEAMRQLETLTAAEYEFAKAALLNRAFGPTHPRAGSSASELAAELAPGSHR